MDQKEYLNMTFEQRERKQAMNAAFSKSAVMPCYEAALDKACDLVADFSGSCPFDSGLVDDKDFNCPEKCETKSTVKCWKEYFINVAS